MKAESLNTIPITTVIILDTIIKANKIPKKIKVLSIMSGMAIFTLHLFNS